MTSPPDPMQSLKRKAIFSTLIVMVLGGILATVLHQLETTIHPISLVIPPFTMIVCGSLLVYLFRYPQHVERVIRILLGWISLIMVFPEYFFLVEAVLDPDKRLIDTLPPISGGLFLLTTGMIVFLRPRGLFKVAVGLWIVVAAPIVIYLLFHPQELETGRGLDLMVTFLPATAINLSLVMFYVRLQESLDQLYIERLHLKEMAEKDTLTQVFNRRAGEHILKSLMEQPNQKLGIILCDIDHFKQVNDRHGHLAGDHVLQQVAAVCQAHLRKKDTFIRWGGEEFLVVVAEDDPRELSYLAERLRRIIAEQAMDPVGRVTASFGVAILQPTEELRDLFDRADRALYQAKALGRNQVVLV